MVSPDREVRGGGCGLGQQRRLRHLAPSTWHQALADVLGASPRRQDDRLGHAAVEIAIYPDVIWLAARTLQEHSASYRTAV